MVYLLSQASIAMAAFGLAPAAATQEQPAGQVADSAVGQVGRRQSREQSVGSLVPAGRVNNRISNRVQSRLRLRIDKNYSRPVNASSALQSATAGIGKVE